MAACNSTHLLLVLPVQHFWYQRCIYSDSPEFVWHILGSITYSVLGSLTTIILFFLIDELFLVHYQNDVWLVVTLDNDCSLIIQEYYKREGSKPTLFVFDKIQSKWCTPSVRWSSTIHRRYCDPKESVLNTKEASLLSNWFPIRWSACTINYPINKTEILLVCASAHRIYTTTLLEEASIIVLIAYVAILSCSRKFARLFSEALYTNKANGTERRNCRRFFSTDDVTESLEIIVADKILIVSLVFPYSSAFWSLIVLQAPELLQSGPKSSHEWCITSTKWIFSVTNFPRVHMNYVWSRYWVLHETYCWCSSSCPSLKFFLPLLFAPTASDYIFDTNLKM